jgi:hypothetical protein
MSGTYVITEIVGTSKDSMDEAIRNGVNHARENIKHVQWFRVEDMRGALTDNGEIEFQAVLKLGFKYDDKLS